LLNFRHMHFCKNNKNDRRINTSAYICAWGENLTFYINKLK